MLTRCPGCGKEIEETIDICPHCKRDFTVAVEGTGRRVGGAPQKPPPKPEIKKPAAKPEAKKPATTSDPRAKKIPAPGKANPPSGQAKPPTPAAQSNDNVDNLPAFMKEALDDPATAGGAGEMDDSALPPHMRGEAVDRFAAAPPQEKAGNPLLYVGIAVVFIGGFAISRLTAKKEAPPPVVADAPTIEDEAADEKAEEKPAKGEEQKPVKISFAPAVDAPTIEDSDAPPVNEPKKRRGKKNRRRRAPARQKAPPKDIDPPAASAPKHVKWRFRSRVINLVTLEPVSDVSVTIFDLSSGQRYLAGTTGSKGEFRKTVPSNVEGYKVLFQHDDYETKFLLSDAHPFADMSEDDRTAIGRKLKQFTQSIRPLTGNADGKIVEKFYLLPREKHGMSLEEALDR